MNELRGFEWVLVGKDAVFVLVAVVLCWKIIRRIVYTAVSIFLFGVTFFDCFQCF
ncbi:uncharacterized protein METZ01_LOCUS466840 [marine metagenome]|uniref:Uncharacterized protein n=1 Tax=marine metagenome TaxID=408172 RepID=A0A383B1C2_9ZZZZ